MDRNINALEQESPGRRLAMLHRLSMAFLSGPLAEMGLGRGKLGFLMRVLHVPGSTQEELTRALCIDPAATARALQALEQDGLVRREEDQRDRRRKLIYPTDKARSMRDRLFSLLDRYNQALLKGLDDHERRNFLRMLDRLVDNMKKAAGRDDR